MILVQTMTNGLLATRQNYAFTGETLDYYVLVRDLDGAEDISLVNLLVDGELVGACAEVSIPRRFSVWCCIRCINRQNIRL